MYFTLGIRGYKFGITCQYFQYEVDSVKADTLITSFSRPISKRGDALDNGTFYKHVGL